MDRIKLKGDDIAWVEGASVGVLALKDGDLLALMVPNQ